jgi:glycerol-3-phosphate dehydrogenase
MIEIAIAITITVFFVALAVGSIAAEIAGRLPTSTQLAEQDQARWARYRRALER